MIETDLDEDELALYSLFMDESGIDQMELTWFDGSTNDGCFRTWPVQFWWWRIKDQFVISAGSRSVGKALDIETPIYTTNGWKTMGTLKVGDFVFDEQGLPTRVNQVHEIQYNRPCYEVKFDDGSSIIADEEHLWKTYRRKNIRAAARQNKEPDLQVETTLSIKESLICAGENNHRVPVAKPLQMPSVELPINPYTFGYWLGDGNSRCHEVTIGDEDIAESNKLINQDGYWLRKLKSKKYGYALQMPEQDWYYKPYNDKAKQGSSEVSNQTIKDIRTLSYIGATSKYLNGVYGHYRSVISGWTTGRTRSAAGGFMKPPTADMFAPILKEMNVYRNKHIPELYFQGSYEQRLELLCGILDTDGSSRKSDGLVEITLASKLLCDDVRRLVLSLGQKASKMAVKQAKCNGVDAGSVYRFTFTPIWDINPFKLKRKRVRVKSNHSSRVIHRRIVDVEPVESRPVRCIEVDSGSHLFLAGENLIPTHNSMSALARAYAFPFVYTGEEMVITAPDGDRLTALTDKVETIFMTNWVANSMLPRGARGNIKHRPFHINFANTSRIMGRIPRHDGTGLQGIHPIVLLQDESSTFPERGWKEVVETVEISKTGGRWLSYGVTMGPGNTFDDIINGKDPDWTVVKLPAMYRPTWTDEERQIKINKYGGYESLDYKRNILGTAVGADASLLSLTRLMGRNMDQDEMSDFNISEYYSIEVTDAMLAEVDDILDLIDPPITHTQYKKTWIGMDYGLTTSKSCILVFSEEKVNKESSERLKLVARVMMSRIPTKDQVEVIKHIMSIYRPIGFGFDAHGVGQPAYEWLQEEVRRDHDLSWMIDRMKGYSFSENIVWDLDDKIEYDPNIKDDWKKAALVRKTSDYSLDILRLVVDTDKLWLPYDDDVIGELRAVPRKDLMTMDEYGKPKRKQGGHILDAFRFALLSWKQQPVEQIVHKLEEDTYELPGLMMLDFA